MIETGFEFKYIVKSNKPDETGEVITVDSVRWNSAKKKIITIQVDEKTREKMHLAKTQARKACVESLNEEHGVGCWRFFD